MSKPIQCQILSEARLLIDEPQHWCRGTFAVARSGRRLTPGSPRADKHCAVSAILLAARRCVPDRYDADRIADSVMLMLAPVGSTPSAAQEYIWSVNDRQGHAAVMALFDKAAATC